LSGVSILTGNYYYFW